MVEHETKNSEMNAPVHQQTALARTFVDYLNRQKMICDELEAIADSLPNNVNNQSCLKIVQTMQPLIKQAHRFEETMLFPKLSKVCSPHHEIDQTIKRLQIEHLSDEDYAEDLCKAIISNLKAANRNSAENLGWMLRGFFESIRRHIAFEREHILPLVNELQSPTQK